MWNKFVIIVSLFIGVYLYLAERAPERITFLDIGQGDAAVIEINDLKILIDVGFSMETVWKLDEVITLNDRKIDIIILTHPHFDHYGGIYEILDRYEVGEVWVASDCEVPFLVNIINETNISINERNLSTKGVTYGEVIEAGGARLKILSPEIMEDGSTCRNSNNINNLSLVIELSYKGKKVLFMGDAEKEVENRILAEVSDVDVLKVGHHCSDTSSTKRFIEKAKPEVSICSYGEDNSFGHPSSSVVNTLEDSCSYVWKTAIDGNYVYVFE
jgi:competence protein ComEC